MVSSTRAQKLLGVTLCAAGFLQTISHVEAKKDDPLGGLGDLGGLGGLGGIKIFFFDFLFSKTQKVPSSLSEESG